MYKQYCDVCQAVIPMTSEMEHNEAAKQFYGKFFRANGVVSSSSFDLCAHCSSLVEGFINKCLKQKSNVPDATKSG